MKNNLFAPKFELKTGIDGQGIFAATGFKEGETLFKMRGQVSSIPTRTSVQVGVKQHIEDRIASHINHSCKPNTVVDRESRTFVATRPIKKGEEITFDYNKNEDVMACPFVCRCCNKQVSGKDVQQVAAKSVINR